jgi:predicted RNase H-like HicB family nuclease
MSSPDRPNKDLNLHILLEPTEAGGAIAEIAEISECRVEAHSREAALAALQQLLKHRLAQMEIIPLTLPLEPPARENPWIEFIGMFEVDAEFAEMAEALRQERGINLDDVA